MIVNEFDITSYVSTFIALVFGSGLLFQLPVVVFFMTKIGLLTPKFMRTYRRHAIVVILIIGAIVTPPDPLSQSQMNQIKLQLWQQVKRYFNPSTNSLSPTLPHGARSSRTYSPKLHG